METRTITFDLTDGVAVITMNRPAVMNALNTTMRTEITAALRHAAGGARVVVLTGTGRVFCSGQDLGDAADLASVDLETVLRDEYEPMLRAVLDCFVPVIAAVNGAAAGAGASLALAADVVIAAESASFTQAFTRIGLIPDAGGTYWLPRQVGFARAMGAMLFGERLSARQAADWGMIWEAVADDGFEAHWRARAAILATGPSLAYQGVKQALRASVANDLEGQRALEARLQGQCGASRDFREGVAAFSQRRPPRFEGQ